MSIFGAESSSFSESSVAIIGAIGTLIGVVFGAVWQVIKYGGDRADRSTADSMRIMAASRDDMAASRDEALEGERRAIADRDRVIIERDEARAETADAYRRRDEWMEKWQTEQARANALEVRLASRPPTDP
jgi:hypothetical protein